MLVSRVCVPVHVWTCVTSAQTGQEGITFNSSGSGALPASKSGSNSTCVVQGKLLNLSVPQLSRL
jgi:hypothetical protein